MPTVVHCTPAYSSAANDPVLASTMLFVPFPPPKDYSTLSSLFQSILTVTFLDVLTG